MITPVGDAPLRPEDIPCRCYSRTAAAAKSH